MPAPNSPKTESAPLQNPPPAIAGRNRRKILFVTNTNEYGGLERHLLDLIRRLPGPSVQVSILNVGPDLYTEHLDNAERDRISVIGRASVGSLRDWFQIFRANRPDIVVFSSGWVWAFPLGSVAARLAGVRRCLSIQHLSPSPVPRAKADSLRSWFRGMIGWDARRVAVLTLSAYFCGKIICVSNAVRESLLRNYRFPAGKTITIYNGVSVSEFHPSESSKIAVRTRLGIGSDEFVLICVARLSEIKGIDILLEALARLLRDSVRFKCLIVGDGPLKDKLFEQARMLGLSGHVLFEGFHEDVRPYLQAASAFVLTSRAEGLPLSILEAMASGLPCVVTDVGGNAEAVSHNVHGLVVKAGSADAVADAISHLITHPQERDRMAGVVRSRVCDMFNIENRMSELIRVILN